MSGKNLSGMARRVQLQALAERLEKHKEGVIIQDWEVCGARVRDGVCYPHLERDGDALVLDPTTVPRWGAWTAGWTGQVSDDGLPVRLPGRRMVRLTLEGGADGEIVRSEVLGEPWVLPEGWEWYAMAHIPAWQAGGDRPTAGPWIIALTAMRPDGVQVDWHTLCETSDVLVGNKVLQAMGYDETIQVGEAGCWPGAVARERQLAIG